MLLDRRRRSTRLDAVDRALAPIDGPVQRVAVALDRVATPPRILAVFVVLLLLGVVSHEMWRDEIHAWAMARDSGSLRELADNAAYEGHPLLWHALLWLASRITRSPVAMQVLHTAIATGFAALVAWAAPFRPSVRAALVLGYFPLYEYGVIARPYSLTALLVVGAAVLARRRPRPLAAVAVLAGLAGLTTAFGTLVAAFVVGAVVLDELVGWAHGRRPRLGAVATAVAVFTGAALVAVAQIVPPADAPFGGSLHTPDDARGRWPFSLVAAALTPVRLLELDAWGMDPWRRPLGVVVGALLFVGVAAALARRPAPLALWVGGAGSMLVLDLVRFHGNVRHHGHIALVLLAACWIADSCRGWRPDEPPDEGPSALPPRLLRLGVAGILTAQVLAAAVVLAADVRWPFSGAPAAAAAIDDAGLADAPVVGDPDFIALAVTGHLDTEAALPGRGEVDTFVRWDARRQEVSGEQLVAAAADRAAAEQEQVVVVAGAALPPSAAREAPGGIRHLGTFAGTMAAEPVHLYVVGPRA